MSHPESSWHPTATDSGSRFFDLRDLEPRPPIATVEAWMLGLMDVKLGLIVAYSFEDRGYAVISTPETVDSDLAKLKSDYPSEVERLMVRYG